MGVSLSPSLPSWPVLLLLQSCRSGGWSRRDFSTVAWRSTVPLPLFWLLFRLLRVVLLWLLLQPPMVMVMVVMLTTMMSMRELETRATEQRMLL